MKQCLECLGPEIRCEKEYGHSGWHRCTGDEVATAWSSRGTTATFPIRPEPEPVIAPVVPLPRILKKPVRREPDLGELLQRSAVQRRDHYDDVRARQRKIAGIPEAEKPLVHVAEHSAHHPYGRSIRPKQVPWVDRDWNG